ncbi:MAG: oligosaccharide flippase family protein [Candidatus Omnitrophota bacterium]|nr:oligosaccharide flippase family protein [Candidatus Omnitrophota bacterium]
MIKKLRNIDTFSRNVIVVFAGASLFNLFNLLYQLLIAHQLSPAHFAAFNSLLSVFIIICAPLNTIQMAVAKYAAEFRARDEASKINFLLADLFRKFLILGVLTFFIFCFSAIFIINSLKIPSAAAAYIFAGLLAAMWLIPFFRGALQGLESFGVLSFALIVTGVIKLALAFVLVISGYDIAGAMAALLVSELAGLGIYYLALRPHLNNPRNLQKQQIDYRQLFGYLLPVAASFFCFMSLVNADMILVKHFFPAEESGFYSLAQMVGKIFLFLPLAISTVMFPRTSGLNAIKEDTAATLRKSLFFALCLCLAAGLFYNSFPALVLRILTGKAIPESIVLGRLFSVSMSFFTLSYVLILYFLSIKDLRFVKYLFCSLVLQILAIIFFHRDLIQVQLILCLNSIVLFLWHLFLARRHGLCMLNKPSLT